MHINIGISDLPPETVICRYMSICKFEKLLKDRAIYFRRLDKLCDKKEGSLGDVDHLYANQTGRNWDEMRFEDENLKKSFFVNCWYVGDEETLKMWEKYAETDGVMVKTNVESLKKCFESVRAKKIVNGDFKNPINIFYISSVMRFGKVEYINYKTAYIGGKIIQERCFYKHPEFREENEYRIALSTNHIYSQNPYTDQFLDQDGINLPVCLESLIHQIVISPYADIKTTNNIRLELLSAGLDYKDLIQSNIKIHC